MLRALPNIISIILEFKESAPHGYDFTNKDFTPQQHKISSWMWLKCEMHVIHLNKNQLSKLFCPCWYHYCDVVDTKIHHQNL